MEKNYKAVDTKINFPAQEEEILQWWEKNQIFQALVSKNKDSGRRWSFLDGPITANNPMGVHHAWGRTYKDIFHRYQAMLGCEIRYQNGFDCQGLWVEVEVERQLKFKSKKDIEAFGIENFVNLCKERVLKYAAIQTEQSKRLGQWMDWDNSYFTMSDENNYAIWDFLKKIHNSGWLRKGNDSMPWCPRCGTGISQHEMTEGYRDIEDKSVFVLLPIDGRDNEFLAVWTTTPWTLPANVAAAVGVDIEYAAIEDDGRIIYMVPEAVSRAFSKKYQPNIVRKLKGSDMVGWTYKGPFDELDAASEVSHKIIAWREVTTEEGTGIVHIAPGCGKDDFRLGKELGLDMIAPVTEAGHYIEGFDWLTGQSALEVADPIIKNLKEKNILLKQEMYAHRYPHCWRCKTKLIYRVVTEWYISMDELRHKMMDVTRQIEWMPAFGLDRELDWLTNMSDWMISKKRYWGLALPIYECEDCGHVMVMGSREELHDCAVSGWDKFDGNTPHRPWIDAVKIACDKCGKPVERIKDVGNPWLDAGIIPFSTLQYRNDKAYWEKWFPADFITESFPGQFRNWFYSLLAMSTVLEERPPFLKVLGYALVKDEKGKDMHKSEGNAIWFDDAADKMGVDVIRWMYASQNPEQNLLFGFGHADEIRKKMLTLWNSYSFLVTYASIDKFDPVKMSVPLADRPEIDRWMIARTEELVNIARQSYEGYRTDRFMRAANDYLEDLSNWYIRRNRRRFWKSENDGDKMAAYTTLHEVLVTFVKVMAPVIPFLSETIYQNLVCTFDDSAPASVHLCDFPEYRADAVDEVLLKEIDSLIAVVGLGRSARSKANIKIRQPLAEILVSGEADLIAAIKKNSEQLLQELNIKTLRTDVKSEQFIQYEVQPNLRLLGPKLGPRLGNVKAKLSEYPVDEIVAKWKSRSDIEVEIDDETIVLTPEEILVEERGIEPYQVAVGKEMAVGINTEISEELKQEGLIRDLVRQVQNMRKEAELNVDDRIMVGISGDSKITSSLDRYENYFLTEVLGVKLFSELERPEFEKVVNLNGASVNIHIARA